MLRRLLAALLVAAIAMPLPAAVGVATAVAAPCPMEEHAAMGANHRCCCNESAPARPDPGAHRDCVTTAAAPAACGCVGQADPGNRPAAAPASPSFEAPRKAPVFDAVRIPASLSTPQRQVPAIHLAAPPPASGLVFRPLLCSWTL